MRLRLPEGAVEVTPPQGFLSEGTFVERWQIRRDGGLAGQTLAIDGIAGCVTDVIVRVERQDGTASWSAYCRSGPSSPCSGRRARARSRGRTWVSPPARRGWSPSHSACCTVFGFAGALAEVGLPQNAIPVALLMFNVGVEVGQLIFVAAVLGGWALLRRLPLHWPACTQYLAPYAIGTLAMFWVIERVGAV